MKTLQITEEQMTLLLKQFLQLYGGHFDHATFDEAPGGYLVHFHQSPDVSPKREEDEILPPTPAYSNSNDDPMPSYMPPISITMPDFGGFGGGSSGGGGASGGW